MTDSWEDAEPILSEVNRGHASLLEVPHPPPHPIQLSLSVVERQPADIKKGQQYYQLLIQLVTVYLGIQLQVSFQGALGERRVCEEEELKETMEGAKAGGDCPQSTSR
jgi:hypothetical protein